MLWEWGQLGNSCPESLLYATWWLLSKHFGLRGCQKHCTINMEDFTINKDGDNGNEFLLTLTESPTKTRQGARFTTSIKVCTCRKCSQLTNYDALSLFLGVTWPRGLKI